MITSVGLYHEPKRKRPWLVCWWGDPDPETSKQRKYTRTFRYHREARQLQAEKQAELNRGAPRDAPVEVTLERLLHEFAEARLKQLSYSSQIAYQNTMDQLQEHFGDRKAIRQIEQRHAETFIATRKRRRGRGGKLASWTIYQHRKHCRVIFGVALEWEYLVRNPFVPAKPKGDSPLRIRGRSKPWHHLTPEEFQRLIAVVPTPRRRAACWLMYGCGLRPGEVYNLTIDRVDLERRFVHVRNRVATPDVPPFTVKAEGQSSESKERSVPIPEAAISDITDAMQQSFKSGGFLVLTAERYATVMRYWRLCREGKPWGGRKANRAWQNRDMVNNVLRNTKAYLRKAEIELTAPFTLHTFRKGFAQNHADSGTPPRTLARLLGHSDASVTMEYYNRVTDANVREAGKTMDRLLATTRKAAAGG